MLSNIYFVHAAASVATLLFAIAAVVQLLISIGMLPVSIAWGGRQNELTRKLRIAGFAAAFVLLLFNYLIRYRAGLVAHPIPGWVRVSAWAITGLMGLNSVGNVASRSRVERYLFTPLTVAITFVCFVVAASRLN